LKDYIPQNSNLVLPNRDDTLASFWRLFLVLETGQSVILFWCQKLAPVRACSISCA